MVFAYKDFPDHPDKPVYQHSFDLNGRVVIEKLTRYEILPADSRGPGSYRIHNGRTIVYRRIDQTNRYYHGKVFLFEENRDQFLAIAEKYYEDRVIAARTMLHAAQNSLEHVRSERARKTDGTGTPED